MPKNMDQSSYIQDVAELLQILEPETVVQDSFDATRLPLDESRETGQGVKFSLAFEDGRLLTTFKFQFVADDCEFHSAHTAVWVANTQVSVDASCMADFLQRVAFMTVFPYFREAISTFAGRLRVAVPTLGLVRQGDVDLQINAQELETFLRNRTFG